MSNSFTSVMKILADFAWGPVMIVLLVGTGVVLSLGTRFIQFRKLLFGFRILVSRDTAGDGDITPFQALMTSLAATVGIGNIAGVASAIASGGPGAVFWMWITAAVGGATKYAEALLAIKYRITNEKGEQSGGPMYYITLGLKERFGGNWSFLGWLFAFFGFVASFGIGNMVQSKSVAQSIETSIGLDPVITGVIVSFSVGLVVVGGIRSIGLVTEKLVPLMSAVYVVGSLVILFVNFSALPEAFGLIFEHAFSAKALGGGFLGTVVRYGVARGLFSNEAGLGSSPIVHAAAKNDDAVIQGIIGSLESFIDTLVICTMTALVILTSGVIDFDPLTGQMEIYNNLSSAALTTTAFDAAMPGGFGGFIVSFGLIFFAFSTILGWYYYGSKCLEFIAGVRVVELYKWVWIILCFFGATMEIDTVWAITDAFNGLMIFPNLIALIGLSPMIIRYTRERTSA